MHRYDTPRRATWRRYYIVCSRHYRHPCDYSCAGRVGWAYLNMAPKKKHGRETLSFASQLRSLRVNLGFTLQHLADKSHVSKSTISKIERRDVQPSLDIAVRLAEALNSTLSEMVRHDEYARVVKIARKDQSVVADPGRKWERRLLSPIFTGANLEMLYATVKPKVNLGTFPRH